MKKILICPGHCLQSPGAINWNTDPPIVEYFTCLKAAEKAIKMLNGSGLKASMFRGDIPQKVQYANSWGAELILEFHLNSANDATAQGTEVIYSGAKEDEAGALILLEELVEAFGRKNRGIKKNVFYNENGEVAGKLGLISGCQGVVYILEPFFISNFQEAREVFDVMFSTVYAGAVAKGVMRILS